MEKEEKKKNNEEKEQKKYKLTHEECGCTEKIFIESLIYLPSESIREILEDGFVEATCETCGKEYKVDVKEIEKVLDKKLGNPNNNACLSCGKQGICGGC